jgi:hypothetical protein
MVKEKKFSILSFAIMSCYPFYYAGNVISSKRSSLLPEYHDLLLLLFYNKNRYNRLQNSPSNLCLITIEEMECVVK